MVGIRLGEPGSLSASRSGVVGTRTGGWGHGALLLDPTGECSSMCRVHVLSPLQRNAEFGATAPPFEGCGACNACEVTTVLERLTGGGKWQKGSRSLAVGGREKASGTFHCSEAAAGSTCNICPMRSLGSKFRLGGQSSVKVPQHSRTGRRSTSRSVSSQ